MENVMEKLNLNSVIRKNDYIMDNVLHAIGSTPLVRVNNIIKASLYMILVKEMTFNLG